MTRRDAQRQGEPNEVDDTFPCAEPGRGTWFRAHTWRPAHPDGGCWYFTSLPAPDGGIGGRFDLGHPRGTCYWTTSELSAVRERIGRPGSVIAHDEVDEVRVARATFDPGQLADLLHQDAATRGITQELAVSVPYELAQRWAATFDAAGFDGVRYQPRFSTERAEAAACFGPAGSPSPERDVTDSRFVVDVLHENGYTVVGVPSSLDLSPLQD